MNQDIIDLYDRFTHGGIARRAFFKRLVGKSPKHAAAY